MEDDGGVIDGTERGRGREPEPEPDEPPELTFEELAERLTAMAPADPSPASAASAASASDSDRPVATSGEPDPGGAPPADDTAGGRWPHAPAGGGTFSASASGASSAHPQAGSDDIVGAAAAADILAATPADHPGARGRRRWPKLVGAGVALVAVAAGGAFAYRTMTAEPKEWDADIRPLATFVENNRGGRFEHPVPITFDKAKDYEKAFAIDDDSVDPKELEDAVGELRALGLVAGDLDLVDTSETLGSEGTVGFYSPEDHKIHVKGSRPDLQKVEVRATLVHELTHAYDFQHFDLDLDDDVSGGEEFGHRAVVEGSARVIEGKYVESLSEADLAKYQAAFDEDTGELKGSKGALDEIPPVFVEVFGMPYELGPRFLDALRTARGEKGVGGALDQALRTWPTTESQVVHPDRYPPSGKARQVPAPKLQPGEVRIEQDASEADFGEVSLAIVLAPHVGADEALAAVEDWSDDAVIRYRAKKGGPACIRVAVAFGGAASADRFQSAAQRWAEAIPGASVKDLDAEGFEGAVLDACDPGAKGPAVKKAAPTVTESLSIRADLRSAFVEQGVPAPAAECVIEHALAKAGTARVLELNGKDEGDTAAIAEVQELFGTAAAECGYQPPGG